MSNIKKLSWRELNSIAVREEHIDSCAILNDLENNDNFVIIERVGSLDNDTKHYIIGSESQVTDTDHGDDLPIEVRSIFNDNLKWLGLRNYHNEWVCIKKIRLVEALENITSEQVMPVAQTNETKLESNMSALKRRTVTIALIDPDPGLEPEFALVARYENIITEDDDATTIQELCINKGIAQKLKSHNEKRATQVNKDIQNRTGNNVMLLPVKLKDLQWEIK